MTDLASSARVRLVAISDELAVMPKDDLGARHTLLTEADELRVALRASADPALLAVWAERAGRKGEHEIDIEVAKALAAKHPSQGR